MLCSVVWMWVATGDQRAHLHSRNYVFFPILKSYQDLNGVIKDLPYMACYSSVALSLSVSMCLSLPLLCCNSRLLFNKQFVSDVLNTSYNLIVCDMCEEVAAGSLPPQSHTCLVLTVHVHCAEMRMKEQSLRVCNYI